MSVASFPWYLLRNRGQIRNTEVRILSVASIKEAMDEKVKLARSERYTLQSLAKKILPSERVAICLRNRIYNKSEQTYDDIKVWKHQKTHRAFYSGLAVCGSVWICPVCAAKISERRKTELKIAFDEHMSQGGDISMLTLTVSHGLGDSLQDILSRFGQATHKFMSGGSFKKIREEIDMIGRVRAMECTYGSNGFHPHLHIALFHKKGINYEEVKNKMYRLWLKACDKYNLITSYEHGMKLNGAEKASQYFTKQAEWKMEHEMTKWHIKKGRKESIMPFDFLRLYISTEDKKYLRLFKEYAVAYKGKRQLQWSAGLKEKYNIKEKSDEELAKEKKEEADLLGTIDFEEWKVILQHDLRVKLLENIEQYGFEKGTRLTLSVAMATIKKESSRHEDSQSFEI